MMNIAQRMTYSPRRVPRPFLKWAGGKTQLLTTLIDNLPAFDGTYHEPFVGGGALFFALLPEEAVLSDRNQELIDCYKTVRDQPEALIEALQKYKYDKESYYKTREISPDHLSLIDRAARMIYLNKTGFNGLYRVNSKGGFNVPMGRYSNPVICDADNLRACSVALKTATLKCRSFEMVVDDTQKGDFVYFDPPYIPLSRSASFTAYEKNGFGMKNQQLLAEVFAELDKKGVLVMLSNADVPWIDEHYRPFNILRIQANRAVNSNVAKRGKVGEVLVTNFSV
jgi:DNA adenine methylase